MVVHQGDFIDPSEAVFVFLGQAQDIDDSTSIKTEILRHRLAKGEKDCEEGRTSSSMEDIRERLKEKMKNNPQTAVWQKISQK